MRTSTRLPAVVAGLSLLGAPVAQAQDAPALVTTAALPVRMTMETSTFAFETGKTLVDVYLAVEARSLLFRAASGGGFEAILPLAVDLGPPSDGGAVGGTPARVWADSTALRFALADTAGIGDGRSFLHAFRAAVTPGEYELRVRVPGTDDRPTLELRRDVRVPVYDDASRVAISDITLASSISPSEDATNPFYRSGVLVRPNATLVFGEALPRLYFYSEVYRAGRGMAPGDTAYTVYTYVSSADRAQAVAGLERRTTRRVRPTDIVAGSFDVRTLPSGAYALRVAVLTSGNAVVSEQSRRFYIYNPDVPVAMSNSTDLDFETSLYATLDEAEALRSLAHLDPVMAERERRRVRELPDLDARRRYLWQYWQERDPNPQTALNEAREEYYRLVAYANERYGSYQTEGWRTDRGRALLKYGLPSSIEPHMNDRETRPYEIWYYNNIPGEGQATFVFGDRRGNGSFEQVSSTVSGERSVPDWQRVLTIR